MTEIVMCKGCKEQISVNAAGCPYCGKQSTKTLKLTKFMADIFNKRNITKVS